MTEEDTVLLFCQRESSATVPVKTPCYVFYLFKFKSLVVMSI